MCGFSGESGVNFGEFTPHFGIVDRGATVLDLQKTT